MQRIRRPVRPIVRLIHWKAEEAAPRIATLRAAGYTVQFGPLTPAIARDMRAAPPAAIVIDFARLPSHGREVAVSIRVTKATRDIPLVIVGGDADKVAALQEMLPEAVYTTWERIRPALQRAIARPPKVTTIPTSKLAGYSGTPLPKKLGVKPGSVVLLVGAPAGFEATLGALPAGAKVTRRARTADLTLWFETSCRALERDVEKLAQHAANGGLWIVWPKKTSGMQSDLGETEVRAIGLANGLVDYKICAVDATWSGLKFSVRKPRK